MVATCRSFNKAHPNVEGELKLCKRIHSSSVLVAYSWESTQINYVIKWWCIVVPFLDITPVNEQDKLQSHHHAQTLSGNPKIFCHRTAWHHCHRAIADMVRKIRNFNLNLVKWSWAPCLPCESAVLFLHKTIVFCLKNDTKKVKNRSALSPSFFGIIAQGSRRNTTTKFKAPFHIRSLPH